jgi:hypothetical protein
MSQVIGDTQNDPAVVGTSKSNDGVRAISTDGNGLSAFSDTNVAIFAQTKSTTKPSIFAQCDAQPAIVGTSKSNDGVRAISTDGNGLSAFSDTSVAIFAQTKSTTKPSIFAECDAQPAIIGTSKSNDGVRAVSTDGNGLSAFSDHGTAVFAKGAKFAGFFDGNVQVTGKLGSQQIPDLIAFLVQIQDRVAHLEQKQAGGTSGSGTGGGGVQAKPQIAVTSEGSGQSSVFKVSGTGFSPSKLVTIRVVDDQLINLSFQATADSAGKLDFRQKILCTSGLALHFSATDGRSDPHDLTGSLFSNTVTISCP